MSIDKTHLVLKANCDALDHVFNVRADCADACNVLSLSVVHLCSELSRLVCRRLLDECQLNVDVVKGLCERAAWSRDTDCAGLERERDCRWDCNVALLKNEPHL